MAAPARVQTQEIVNALIRWRGNVQAAAQDLGLTRNSLYERIQRSGIDLDGFRRAVSGKPVIPITDTKRVRGFGHADRRAREDAADRFTGSSSTPNLGGMEIEQATEAPIRPAPSRRPATRLKPAHQDMLRQAKLVLGGRFMIETDENRLLEQFIDERFEAWLEEKLAPTNGDGK